MVIMGSGMVKNLSSVTKVKTGNSRLEPFWTAAHVRSQPRKRVSEDTFTLG
ncbi:rCG54433 [Rattus norvegicus]|uniref:RCG54433 n=1 Tax=Rattus norvegicus TaxID=10116 RepID=A6JAF4_RAT|nr:rCG54433 [Rattus norvegicus]